MSATLSRFLSPSLFGLVLFLFFLPFVTVSCPPADIATLSGVQVATGTDIGGTGVEPSLSLLAAIGVAILGLVVAIATAGAGQKVRHFAYGTLGALGVFLLILFRLQTVVEMMEQEVEVVTVSFHAAYYLCLLTFGSAGALGFHSCYEMRQAPEQVAYPAAGQSDVQPSQTVR